MKQILTLRYKFSQSWFYLAEDHGYFVETAIDMVMDQGSGSGAAVGQVAGGGTSGMRGRATKLTYSSSK